MKLFSDDDERSRVLICSAAVALHALVAGRVPPIGEYSGMSDNMRDTAIREWQIKEAFAIAREFIRQAETLT